jgi:cell volume regulation protein A
VRKEVADEFPALLERWRSGPWQPPPARQAERRASSVIFSSRPWAEADGDAGRPSNLLGLEVIEHLRTRRDTRGALVALSDGRYAVTGPVLAVGAPGQLQRYARRRLRGAGSQVERAWWQEVIGALAR